MTNYKLHNDCKILSQRVYPENRHEATNGWSHKGTYSNNIEQVFILKYILRIIKQYW